MPEEEGQLFSPDADLDAYLQGRGMSARDFARLPVCHWNVSTIPWLRDWLISHGLPVPTSSAE